MFWFASVVSADVAQSGVDQGSTNMASHIVGFLNSVGIVLGHWVFGPRLVLGCFIFLVRLASCSVLRREETLH